MTLGWVKHKWEADSRYFFADGFFQNGIKPAHAAQVISHQSKGCREVALVALREP